MLKDLNVCTLCSNSNLLLVSPGMVLKFVLTCKAVAFQFLRIGYEQDGMTLLQDLADDKDIGAYVNFRLGLWAGH